MQNKLDKNFGPQIESASGYNLLMLRVEEGNFSEVEMMLKMPNVRIDAENKSGQTALALAVRNGNQQIAGLLLQYGANVNSKNKSGQTPLFIACWYNMENLVTFLIENKADVNIADYVKSNILGYNSQQRGWTPLMIACHHAHPSIVRILLSHGASVTAVDSFGKKASDRCSNPEILRMLGAPVGPEPNQIQSHRGEQIVSERRKLSYGMSNNKPFKVFRPGIDVLIKYKGIESISHQVSVAESTSPTKPTDSRQSDDFMNLKRHPSRQKRESTDSLLNEGAKTGFFQKKKNPPQLSSTSKLYKATTNDLLSPPSVPNTSTSAKSTNYRPLSASRTTSKQYNDSELVTPKSNGTQNKFFGRSDAKSPGPSEVEVAAKMIKIAREKNLDVPHDEIGSLLNHAIHMRGNSRDPSPNASEDRLRLAPGSPLKEGDPRVVASDIRKYINFYANEYNAKFQQALKRKLVYALGFESKRGAFNLKKEFHEIMNQKFRDFMSNFVSSLESSSKKFVKSQKLDQRISDVIETNTKNFLITLENVLEADKEHLATEEDELKELEKKLVKNSELDDMIFRELEDECNRAIRNTNHIENSSEKILRKELLEYLKIELIHKTNHFFQLLNDTISKEAISRENNARMDISDYIVKVFGRIDRNIRESLEKYPVGMLINDISEIRNSQKDDTDKGFSDNGTPDKSTLKLVKQSDLDLIERKLTPTKALSDPRKGSSKKLVPRESPKLKAAMNSIKKEFLERDTSPLKEEVRTMSIERQKQPTAPPQIYNVEPIREESREYKPTEASDHPLKLNMNGISEFKLTETAENLSKRLDEILQRSKSSDRGQRNEPYLGEMSLDNRGKQMHSRSQASLDVRGIAEQIASRSFLQPTATVSLGAEKLSSEEGQPKANEPTHASDTKSPSFVHLSTKEAQTQAKNDDTEIYIQQELKAKAERETNQNEDMLKLPQSNSTSNLAKPGHPVKTPSFNDSDFKVTPTSTAAEKVSSQALWSSQTVTEDANEFNYYGFSETMFQKKDKTPKREDSRNSSMHQKDNSVTSQTKDQSPYQKENIEYDKLIELAGEKTQQLQQMIMNVDRIINESRSETSNTKSFASESQSETSGTYNWQMGIPVPLSSKYVVHVKKKQLDVNPLSERNFFQLRETPVALDQSGQPRHERKRSEDTTNILGMLESPRTGGRISKSSLMNSPGTQNYLPKKEDLAFLQGTKNGKQEQ